MDRVIKQSRKILIGIIGGLVLTIGLILIPYPGPGWLIVFGGLAILATEFEFAGSILEKARAKYDEWVAWLKRQPMWVQLIVLAATGLVVVATVWLLNGFGLINQWFNLGLEWLTSPLFR